MTTFTHDGVPYQLPFANLFRALAPAEDDELRASIRVLGVMNPVMYYDSPANGPNCIIDGLNRLRIGAELGVTVPFAKFAVTDDTARRLAEDLNIARRQVTPAEARAARAARVVQVVAARAEGKSLRAIATEHGVSQVQVFRDLKESGVTGVTPDRIAGADGKSYPTARPPEPEHLTAYTSPEDDELFDEEPEPEPVEPDAPTDPPALALPTSITPQPRNARPTKAPAHQDDSHPYQKLLAAIVALATQVSTAVNESDTESKIRSYLLAVKFVVPRAKIVRGRHYKWQCVGLRGLYRVIDLAGRTGKALKQDQVAKNYAEALDPDKE